MSPDFFQRLHAKYVERRLEIESATEDSIPHSFFKHLNVHGIFGIYDGIKDSREHFNLEGSWFPRLLAELVYWVGMPIVGVQLLLIVSGF
jgi:hypothetical protein